jgi:ABC-type bacteriocin/lantibiotic exporter with double-glycine peptidase domain
LKSDLLSLPSNGEMDRRSFLKLVGSSALAAIVKPVSGACAQQITPEACLIKIPYYRQETDYYCGVACLQMVLAYLLYPQPPPSQRALAEEIGVETARITLVYKMLEALRLRGYTKVYFDDNLTIGKLKELISYEVPTIAFGGFAPISHWVVAVGYDDICREMIVHDPGKGPEIRYEYQLFDDLWTSSLMAPGRRGIVVPYKGTGRVPEFQLASIASLVIPLALAHSLMKNYSRRRQHMR